MTKITKFHHETWAPLQKLASRRSPSACRTFPADHPGFNFQRYAISMTIDSIVIILKGCHDGVRNLGDGVGHHQQLQTLGVSHSLWARSSIMSTINPLYFGRVAFWLWFGKSSLATELKPEELSQKGRRVWRCLQMNLKYLKVFSTQNLSKENSPITLFAPASFSMSAACATKIPSTESTSNLSDLIRDSGDLAQGAAGVGHVVEQDTHPVLHVPHLILKFSSLSSFITILINRVILMINISITILMITRIILMINISIQ